MELRQLAYFDAVVRHGSFTKAAQRLHVAQPAVSAQIRRLESELGTALLERTTRRVALTHAGELFLARARQVLAQLDGARADLAELSAVRRGRVRVGATQVLGSLDLPAALAQFRRRYPGVSLALRTGLIAKLLGLLDAGEVDLIARPGTRRPARRLPRPPAGVREPGAGDPAGPPARRGPGRGARRRPGRAVRLPAGRQPAAGDPRRRGRGRGLRAAHRVRDLQPGQHRDLVSAGLGVALLARSAAEGPGPAIGICELARAPEHPPIGLIHARGRPLTPAARAFADHLAGTGPAPGRRLPAGTD